MYCIRDRRGSSVLPVVWIIGTIFGISLLTGLFRGSISGGNFFAHTSRAVSKTIADVFHRAETKPVFEINLGASTSSAGSSAASGEKNVETKKEKISSAASVISGNEGASIIQSLAPPTKNEIVAPEPASSSIAGIKDNSSATNASAAQETAAAPICNFSSGKILNHKILINEIAWMGTDVSASDEWMELRNNSGADILLSGWQIKNQDESLKINFAGGDAIPSGGFYLLERTDDESVPKIKADKIYVGALSNGGEWIRVFDKNCGLVDDVNALDGWPGGDNATKKTLERNVYDFEWHTSAQPSGTPRARNLETIFVAAGAPPQTPGENSEAASDTIPRTNSSTHDGAASSSTLSQSAPAAVTSGSESSPPTTGGPNHLLLSQIQITGGTGLTNHDFIRIYNPTGVIIDVSSWKLRKRNQAGSEDSIKVFPAGSSIFAGGTFTWANSANDFYLTVGANVSSTQILSDNYSVALEDSSGVVIDAVAWGSGHTNPFIESTAYPDNPGANQILTRRNLNGAIVDTDNNATDFEIR